MSQGTEIAPATVSQVYRAFQSKPMQDIPSFTDKVKVPGVGPLTAEKLLKCDIKGPCALLGQFMVNFDSLVIFCCILCFLIACGCTLGVFICTVVCCRYWTATPLGCRRGWGMLLEFVLRNAKWSSKRSTKNAGQCSLSSATVAQNTAIPQSSTVVKFWIKYGKSNAQHFRIQHDRQNIVGNCFVKVKWNLLVVQGYTMDFNQKRRT